MDGNAGESPSAASVEALLEEVPWLRRLARGLLGDEAAAEDLSQDVLAAALSERVALSGFRLRAWLRTVARRIAGRSLERERSRRAVEEGAARSEIERDASERLEIHRRLAAAIERLPAIYRTALVLRYFEELPPRVIAERLGLPPTAVRKRLSRGLALLRAELDREYGERDSWALALAACLPERTLATPTPRTEIGATGATVIAMSTLKLALLALPVAALGLWWVGSSTRAEPAIPVSPDTRAEPMALPSSAAGLEGQGAGESARRAVESPVEAPVAATPVAAPRLRVVDGTGEPVAGARIAAIDPLGFVRPIVLDDAGSAELADDSLGSRFVASAPGHGPVLSEPWTSDDLELALAPMRIVQGILLEDGRPPEEPIELRCWYSAPAWLAGPNAQAIEYELDDLEILEAGQRVRTGDGGSFRFQCPQEATTASLHVPPSHVVMAVDGVPATGEFFDRDFARVRTDAGDVRIETARLPFLSGRLVRADDGTAVAADVTWWLVDRPDRTNTMFNMASDLDGSFRIGLQLDKEALLLPPSERAAQVTARSAHMIVDDRRFKHFHREVDLEGVEFPYDLGTIALEMVLSVDVRVVDRAAMGVEGALVWTIKGSMCTDRDGLARIDFEPGAELYVLAPGYSLGHLPLQGVPAERVELTLEPGLALQVLVHGKNGERVDAGVRAKLAWNRTPFQGARPGTRAFPDAQFAFARLSTRGLQTHVGGGNNGAPGMPGYRFLKLPAKGPLVIPCLEMGGEIAVSLVDTFERPLVERVVHLQIEPGVQTIELEAPELHQFRLLVTEDGQPLSTGTVRAVPTGAERGNRFPIRDGEAHVGPTTAGTYDLEIEVPGRPTQRIEACELAPGAPPLEIELER